MVVVAVVSDTTKPDRVVMEAARQADDHGMTVHVLYVQGLGWYANLEMILSDRLGILTGTETVREVCERKAERIAEPMIDEYEAVGLIGRPIDEIVQYIRQVDGGCVVLDSEANWGAGFESLYRDPLKELQGKDIPVVPVY